MISVDLVIEQLALWSEDLYEKIERLEESCGDYNAMRNTEMSVLRTYQDIIDSAIHYLEHPEKIEK